jgi:signal transduction histidine kinase/ActR/RegA family two-component response regulator
MGLSGRPVPGGPLAWAALGATLTILIVRRTGVVSAARRGHRAEPVATQGATDAPRVTHGYVQPITPPELFVDEDSRQVQKMDAVGRLAGGVAHDFNNLLTIINGCSDLLLSRPTGDGGVHELVQEIRSAGERGTALTRQLLAFSRKQVIQPKLVDLSVLLKDLEKMLRRLVREDIQLVLHLHPSPLPVLVDPGQIEQVLMNLVINARDAMPTGGTITVSAGCVDEGKSLPGQEANGPPGPQAVLKVRDTGFGMDGATLARIFEPFFTTKDRDKGTGLGLATVYGIVQQSGGVVEVASTPGKGTTFRIRLPLAATEMPGDAKPEVRPDSDRCGNETILLVEDEDGVRSLVKRTLEGQGYSVLEARDGMEALVWSRKHRGSIDLVLTDVVMPHLGGAELVPLLKRRYPKIRTIFMSGYTESVVVNQGVAFGEALYLDKPFTAEGLTRLVRQALEQAPASVS